MEYTVALSKIIEEFSLEIIYAPENIGKIEVSSMDINRPGLTLTDFYELFDPRRIQIIGLTEHRFISEMSDDMRVERIDTFFAHKPPCVIFSSSLDIFPEVLAAAEKHGVPVLRTPFRTSYLTYAVIAYLNVQLAPRVTRHGVLVEIYGEGVLIVGDSGIGKSETAIELVKRGHRLIADDAVEIKRVSAKALVGSAPELIRHIIELRGIGIVDVRRIFGMGAVKMTEKIDLIVSLEPWDKAKTYDRFGSENNCMEILGIKVPSLVIPVRPGRNLAVILEIAAMNNRQKKMGYNTADEFTKRLTAQMAESGKNIQINFGNDDFQQP